ncbi:cytochrome D ubiquinol oxidase subunit I [Ameyamaea chiangmaiensis]|uniref:Cytochrome D ubiquinol oxidase subunit I n=1 Tax=Ameyamaea chiangmaiensis TaxID=442969 RepID=A0A850PBC2_9PROT|nr:pyridoxal-dependent decarboxylase [Ameyamaea chiangmaiensis]MBS4073755.1 cytochrome D ubiquinol oxidase subunit I [Ameyamaea chiangmaiensis]NVN39979.1 cytochrome D ubiquinol oxidase subunit I [Ameyamaea chiangmaiensis]
MAGLDPDDWRGLRALGHRMLDDMFDRLEHVGDGPVWRPMPGQDRDALRTGLPRRPAPPEEIYARFTALIAPYATGNTHPRFMGWVHGAGTGVGMLAEMLAAGLNANCGGRDHAPIEVEREVIRWAAEMVGLPTTTSGLLVTGSSMANLIAIVTASRARPDGVALRHTGVGARPLVGYAARTAHGCIARAFDICGLGTDSLRLIDTDDAHRMCPQALARAIAADRQAGREPFIVVATAGTVDVGAVDDLETIGAIARDAGLWFHVDGAFGALARLAPRHRAYLDGIEQADSLAFDFHKWAQVPYDAGCVLIRDAGAHAAAFAQTLAYLQREDRGLAGNAPWFCDLGPDLSRGFRALKVWMTLSAYGADRLGEMVDACCAVAAHLAARVEREPDLERLAPVTLNIVCFRVRASDAFNAELVKDLQEAGIAAPSTTTINGRCAIRAAIVNHRTTNADVDALVDAALERARSRS